LNEYYIRIESHYLGLYFQKVLFKLLASVTSSTHVCGQLSEMNITEHLLCYLHSTLCVSTLSTQLSIDTLVQVIRSCPHTEMMGKINYE